MVVIKKIQDGPEICIIHVFMRSEGAELDQYPLIDPRLLNGFNPRLPKLEVQELCYDFAGFDAVIQFETGVIEQSSIWVLPAGSGAEPRRFSEWGNFRDYSGLDGTGVLTISTNGFTTSADQGSMFLRVRKNVYSVNPAP